MGAELTLLAQNFLSPGDEAIFTEHGFLVYKIYIQAAGAVPVSGKSDATKSLVIKNILSDYDRNAAPWRLPPLVILIQHGQSQNPQLLPFFLPTADRPPEAAVA